MQILLRRITLVIIVFISLVGCAEAQQEAKKLPIGNAENVLIVYLSRTNNTKALAEIIQQNTKGTLVGLELEKPYPKDYKTAVDIVAKENKTGLLPPLKTKIENIEKYDIIFIGFPNWGMQLPPPLKGFLNEYDLTGKTIIPFNTNAGYGIGNSIQTIKELCPNSMEQRFTNEEVTYSYNLGIVAPVKSVWTTEEREKYVFEPILRPIYKELLNQITKIGKNNFFRVHFGMLPHRMYEVIRQEII